MYVFTILYNDLYTYIVVYIYTYTYAPIICPTPADSIHIPNIPCFNQCPFTWALQVMKVGGKGILEGQETTVEKGTSQADYVNLILYS